jgi:pyruvate/2-oxoglutarate dehydrogenase complex dihydrolipoamide acyltransferase (E2) component
MRRDALRRPEIAMSNIKLIPLHDVSTFRRLAVASWDPPRDPTTYGSLEVDATPLLAHLAAMQALGSHVTLTHLIGRAVAVVLAERPHLNVVIRRRRFYRREDVDIFFQVALGADGATESELDLSGVLIRNADTKSTAAIAQEFETRVEAVRGDRDPALAGLRRTLGRVPPRLLPPLHRVLDWLQYTWNLALPGLPRDPFGSAAITNVGMFGVRWGYAPLFPPAHCPIVILVGAVTRRPWVVDDEQGERLEIRPVLPLHATFDHRVLDGVQAARFATRLEALLRNPASLDPAIAGGAA